MARTVADCALFRNVLAGPATRDPASMRPAVRIPADLEGMQRPARRLQHRAGGRPVDPEIRTRTRAAVEALRAGGVLVAEVEIGWRLDEIKRALWAHFGRGDVAGILALDSRCPGVITPHTLAFARRGMAADPTPDSAAGKNLEAVIQEQLDSVIARFNAFALPTLGATAFAAGEDYVETQLVVNGVALDHFSDASLTPAFNICSAHPVLSVPSNRASNGVPTGVQVVADPDDDVTAFRVAMAIEQTAGAGFGTGRPPVLAIEDAQAVSPEGPR
ncbi:amidase family protein [Streptomyces anthocyanicus]|uniref:amidase family protein n=1 Tax=Streptomyces anthocyanicus TaxID=68174 RepID=UPI0037FCE7C0